MPNNSSKSWPQLILELLEAIFKPTRRTRKTWHQHVVPYEGAWAVRREGNKGITSKHRRQETAINKAKRIAKKRKADVIIHREDGTIRDRIQYD
ncbi:DUF2188 domain-containing protein [Geojedonia litorea]|uniref:DUF2188 domain-containing protein n=1 Tax=Geojedonia litorea TaxID=1268269 RepID=A0ABV9N0I7_9FLAO